MLDSSKNAPLLLQKIKLNKALTYASDLWDLIPDIFNKSDFLLVYSAKDTGKSSIGYQKMKAAIESRKDVIYARLQLKEKESSMGDIAVYFNNVYNMQFEKLKGFGGDNFYLDGDTTKPRIKFVSLGDYQSLRSSINNNTGLIFFDEINANAFPSNFIENFINSISTLSRGSAIQFYGCGNNETAENNPLLSMLKIGLDWSYPYLQIAYRVVQGLIITVIQIGGLCFNDKRPKTFAQRLGSLNENYKNKFLMGINVDEFNKFIFSIPEFVTLKHIAFQFVFELKVYQVFVADINDIINNRYNENCLYIIEKLKPSPNVPIYAIDPDGEQLFKFATILDQNDAQQVFTSLFYQCKQENLFFENFEIRDLLFILFARFKALNFDFLNKVETIK